MLVYFFPLFPLHKNYPSYYSEDFQIHWLAQVQDHQQHFSCSNILSKTYTVVNYSVIFFLITAAGTCRTFLGLYQSNHN